ncbi:hypothetical protein K438DRAFT_1990929 [Mycena galopus ATCC 62051]|nr:hypothetical protein K438DRAFT_1990929 [Mycena galopus ATCC 62051]
MEVMRLHASRDLLPLVLLDACSLRHNPTHLPFSALALRKPRGDARRVRQCSYSNTHPDLARVWGDPLTLLWDNDDGETVYPYLSGAQASSGLALDRLTVLGPRAPTICYETLDMLVCHGTGWKELYYLAPESAFIGYRNTFLYTTLDWVMHPVTLAHIGSAHFAVTVALRPHHAPRCSLLPPTLLSYPAVIELGVKGPASIIAALRGEDSGFESETSSTMDATMATCTFRGRAVLVFRRDVLDLGFGRGIIPGLPHHPSTTLPPP